MNYSPVLTCAEIRTNKMKALSYHVYLALNYCANHLSHLLLLQVTHKIHSVQLYSYFMKPKIPKPKSEVLHFSPEDGRYRINLIICALPQLNSFCFQEHKQKCQVAEYSDHVIFQDLKRK